MGTHTTKARPSRARRAADTTTRIPADALRKGDRFLAFPLMTPTPAVATSVDVLSGTVLISYRADDGSTGSHSYRPTEPVTVLS